MGLPDSEFQIIRIFEWHCSSATKKMSSTGQALLWRVGRNCRTEPWGFGLQVVATWPRLWRMEPPQRQSHDLDATWSPPSHLTCMTWVPLPRVTRSAFGECTPVLRKFVQLWGQNLQENPAVLFFATGVALRTFSSLLSSWKRTKKKKK